MTSRKKREETRILSRLRELNFRLQHIEHVTNLLIRVSTQAVAHRRLPVLSKPWRRPMNSPVNVDRPCAGDAFVASSVASDTDDCDDCAHYVDYGSKCLGPDGWPFMALAALEVARERAQALSYPYPVTLRSGATR